MASFKSLAFVAAILAVAAVSVSANTLLVGRREVRDKLACYGNVHLAAQPGRVVSATRICNVPDYRQIINYIEAKDLGSAGRGGYAQITNGGLYQKTVTVYMWSQPGQPLDFSLNVFGKIY